MGENSWIIDNLNAALNTWNEKLAEIWQLLTQGLADFKGGGVWNVMLNVHSAMTAIGLGLLVLFFAVGVVKTCGSFAEARRPEHALKLFIRFVLAKAAVQYGLELMLAVFDNLKGSVGQELRHRTGHCITRHGCCGYRWIDFHDIAAGDRGQNQRSGVLEQHPAVGCHAAGRAVYYSFVLRYDHDSIWAYV